MIHVCTELRQVSYTLSTVAFYFVVLTGYDVFGVHMQNWNSYDEQGVCSGEDDYQAACKAAKMIDIPIKLLNYEKEYWNLVFRQGSLHLPYDPLKPKIL